MISRYVCIYRYESNVQSKRSINNLRLAAFDCCIRLQCIVHNARVVNPYFETEGVRMSSVRERRPPPVDMAMSTLVSVSARC